MVPIRYKYYIEVKYYTKECLKIKISQEARYIPYRGRKGYIIYLKDYRVQKIKVKKTKVAFLNKLT